MSSLFDKKVVVVTGAASGIGLATVPKLLDLGATVHGVDRASKLVAALKGDHNFTFHGGVDISSRAVAKGVFQNIRQTEDKMYGLVNSAGIAPYSKAYLETDEDYLATIGVNQHGTWYMGTEFLRYIEAKTPLSANGRAPEGQYAIVNIGSSASLQGYSALSAYVTSKHAVLGMSRSWAIDYAIFGVRINVVAPGGVDTPLA
ncbi:uncharacterized protein A1O9_11829 [Exophiala aquamarina CBS 119918]|uniref:3-oxoacyl-[acyl-carrier protein] reductase n=1 Tax=Exophiala aquamarina CBS 119918 TaxID=1182545 RepID=A0A072NXP8_9EURO|nr:uncharacterized protein A1O9_11829 [Exophiala aquamarina CBS 119918]KEF52202.1 hypothetical protein A1O9_11829 [Exophiala aquamarina CBS 119918]